MASRLKVAISTYRGDPFCNKNEEKILGAAFEERNCDFIPVSWCDKYVNWDDYSAIAIRTVFDYHERADEFRAWVEERKLAGKPRMWNSPDIVLWNMHKRYLEYFREKGINVPEIVFCEQGSKAPDLRHVLHENNWPMAVVKPAISANGYRLFAIDPENAYTKQATFEKYVSEGDMMIQKYVKEIERNGEYSLMYFDKVYSHAVLKMPVEGDFRANPAANGQTDLVAPPSRILEFANNVISLVKEDLVYGRVDLVELSNGEATLIEFEVIEPVLYLAKKEGTAAKFVEAFMKYQ